MLKSIVKLILVILFVIFFTKDSQTAERYARFWDFQSIDAMKYSRDIAREKLHDTAFDAVIERQVHDIAETGATHVALATPYDEEFLPFLERWVHAARKENLKVWFRGNWSGWERWFDYGAIDRKTHIEKTRQFILDNPELFEDGDVFSACPECENGGPGDPRMTGNVQEYRDFLIEEFNATEKAFDEIGKDVSSNYASMNGDVARLIMDKKTTEALDGVVVIDHYVADPEKLARDIQEIAENSGGNVVLGEFGAPILDIHGAMSEEEQAAWIEHTLTTLIPIESLVGINYWVNVGGSTELWDGAGNPRNAVTAIAEIYRPKQIQGVVTDEIGNAVSGATIEKPPVKAESDARGTFVLPVIDNGTTMNVYAEGYFEKELTTVDSTVSITLVKKDPNIIYRLLRFLKRIGNLQ
ncbi:MAG TPA: hypothetical protein VJL83_03080 [Patescibacteria group bacterium]|nr:hypothetical protein [Patescibacteria group bacterium]